MFRINKEMRVSHIRKVLWSLVGTFLIVTILKLLWNTETRITKTMSIDFKESVSISTKTDNKIYVQHVEFGAGEKKIEKSKLFTAKPKTKHVVLLNLSANRLSILNDILLRFGRNNNLSVSLYTPEDTSNNADVILAQEYKADVGYDIVVCRSLLTYPKRIIRDDAVRFTFIESPYDRAINDQYARVNEKTSKTRTRILDGIDMSQISNTITKSLGLEAANRSDMLKNIEGLFKKIRKKVGIILLQERLKESLILMRRMLNWTLSDILFLHKDEVSALSKLSKDDIARIKSENDLDMIIYDNLETLFEAQIKEMDLDFEEELNHFEIILTQVLGYCNQRNRPTEPFPIEATAWNKELFVPWENCDMFRMSSGKKLLNTNKLNAN